MMELFNSLEPLQKYFWIIACCASLIFIIQTIMTFVGLGTDADVDAGPMDGAVDSVEDGELSGVFSFRNLINFLLGYGWAGALLFGSIDKRWLLQIIAIGVGLLFVLAFVFMFRQVMKLSHDGSFQMKEAVGLKADVYLRIPAARSGRGKVQVSVKGSIHEIDAVTDSKEEIPTGGQVKIVDALGNDLLLVE
ncbi:MAG: serine protease [Bacteroidaceae bacterium]|jgi:membrane protein implicated in regulation of membrane protease activity|nr:serine protease [Bacteroidaceae bacterium]